MQTSQSSHFRKKFIDSEKATKFWEISTLILSVCTVDKNKVEISQNFVAFSEYTNFNQPNKWYVGCYFDELIYTLYSRGNWLIGSEIFSVRRITG